jgi:dTDP-4-dehydrorhamnose 3,5-epimerase-like enzyme
MERVLITKLEPAHKDDRGYILNVIDDARISHVAVFTSRAGTVRGNHYHPEQLQWVYLVSGHYVSHSKDVRVPASEVEKHVIEAGTLVFAPPMVAHAQAFLEDSVLLNITDGTRESERFDQHTVGYELVPRGR